ncbi:MAG: redoxin domain-containing protein [Deltaproteobacteria bacterium]|nr:redoxin domain-containing protein [Deltaproteobacteria bacterium]
MSANAIFSQNAFVDFAKIKHSLLSDRDGKAMKALGVWDDKRNLAKRSYIIIDKEGLVRFKDTRPSNRAEHLLSTETLLNEIKKINKGS